MGINNSGYQITENHWDNNECREDDTISPSLSVQIKTPTQKLKLWPM